MPKKTSPTSSLGNGGPHFDEAAADRACAFIEGLCRHWKGEWAGKPLVLEPWQRDRVIRPLFGWKRADGTRQYRTVYVEVPKKNGKSTLAAAVANLLLFADKEQGGEIYSAAADRKQAEIVFRDAKQMALQSPPLRARCEVYRRSLFVPATQSRYEVISADAPTKHGLNPSGIIFDELHAQKTRDLWDTLVSGGGARRQPLVFAITTAGYDTNTICYEIHDYALKILDGVLKDDSFLAVVYGAGPEDDWASPKVWAKANPSLGVTIKKQFLVEECRKAKDSLAKQNSFRRLHLDQWTEQLQRWISMEVWNECAGEAIHEADLRGRECYGGLDLSSTTDVTAFVLVFPPREKDEKWKVLCWFWIPAENVAVRVKRDRVPYDAWAREGLVNLTIGNVVDYDVIRTKIGQLGAMFNIRELAYDRWGAAQISTQLAGDGFTVVPFGQGYASMSPAAKAFETLLIGRQLHHGGNAVMKWMASNAQVQMDNSPAENIKPVKLDRIKRVDGIVALVMAVGRASLRSSEAPMVWAIS